LGFTGSKVTRGRFDSLPSESVDARWLDWLEYPLVILFALEKEDLAAAGATVTAAGSILAVTAAAVATVGAAAAVIAVDCPGEEPCTIWL